LDSEPRSEGPGNVPATPSRIIGVLGGMGPLATADLYRKIIEETPAARDQDHLHVMIDADPAIPDRTAALLEGGPDPRPRMIAAARRLEAAGAGVLLIPCNTAHAFLPDIEAAVGIPILHMIRAAAAQVGESAPGATRVGVLATAGTVKAGLYERALAAHGLSVIYPDASGQEQVSAGIAGVKGGSPDAAVDTFAGIAESLARQGADVLIAGCTEIPIVLEQSLVSRPLVDPTRVLARAAVRWARADLPSLARA
jgi:aspartate racemase